ncbi:hypothetical protein [Nocardioides sp. GXZ039]|uniref:hypothetical protein n=1 Tax=Nocardioides sp. GXZ039 TaxID=3136018 RepID=UPI0030F3ADFE
MPPLLMLLAPVLLIALAGLLVLRRRQAAEGPKPQAATGKRSIRSSREDRSSEPSAAGSAGAASGAPLTGGDDEVRLLRLQVETLTEALDVANGRGPAAPAAAATPAAPAAPTPSDLPDLPSLSTTTATMPAVEPLVAQPTQAAEPAAPVAPVAPVVPTPVADGVSLAYTDLSRSLAGLGRLREAAVAQWAADLRILAPLLPGRAEELAAAVASLDAEPAAVIASARAAATAMIDPSVELSTVFADVAHLSGAVPVGGAVEPRADVSADVLPDNVVRALETVLVGSAEHGGDAMEVSVGLRCDVVAHLAPSEIPARTASDVVRDVLEPHERDRFDAALAGLAS